MSANVLKDNLNEFKDKVKEKWGNLTDKDSASLTGDADQLADILQQRLGYAKEQAAKSAQEFIKDFKNGFKSNDKEGDSSMGKSVGEAADKISDISKDVCDKTVEAAKHIKENAGEYGKAVTQFVEHKPYQSIAIAAIAGLVLGFMFRKN
ncbi:MAG: hypothetical protein K0R24_51 [Gammaproteobacteria bacterium]|nr:hypothetical protein [Gammaproteobacteria bacterium]